MQEEGSFVHHWYICIEIKQSLDRPWGFEVVEARNFKTISI